MTRTVKVPKSTEYKTDNAEKNTKKIVDFEKYDSFLENVVYILKNTKLSG